MVKKKSSETTERPLIGKNKRSNPIKKKGGGTFTQVKEETKQKKDKKTYTWVKVWKEEEQEEEEQEEEEQEEEEQEEDEYVYDQEVVKLGDTFEIYSDLNLGGPFGKLILGGEVVEKITDINGCMKYKLLIQTPYTSKDTIHTVQPSCFMCERKWKMFLI